MIWDLPRLRLRARDTDERDIVALGAADVNTSSAGVQPKPCSDLSASALSSCLAARPKPCMLEALPTVPVNTSSIAAATSGCIGDVAAWSK